MGTAPPGSLADCSASVTSPAGSTHTAVAVEPKPISRWVPKMPTAAVRAVALAMLTCSDQGPLLVLVHTPVPVLVGPTATWRWTITPGLLRRRSSPMNTAGPVALGSASRKISGLSTTGVKQQLTLDDSLYSVATWVGSSPASE